MTIKKHIAILQSIPVRFQEYGVGIFPSISTKSALKKAIKKGEILINGKTASTAIFIRGGELIEHVEKQSAIKPVNVNLQIIHDENHFAIINKPAGIEVSGNKHMTVTNALPQQIKKSTLIDALKNPLPVHRLDYATSGLLIIAKTKTAQVYFESAFQNKTIIKTYHAVTMGAMSSKGHIALPIDGKVSETRYKTIKSIASERFTKLNLVVLYPKTGRRHQLRKHLKSIGNAILGDQLYSENHQILKGKGLYLQATGLHFSHPISEEEIKIEIPLAEKFRKLFPQ